MAKLTSKDLATSLNDADLGHAVQNVATTPVSKKVPYSLLKSFLKTYFDGLYAANLKVNLVATVAPTINEDTGDGYSIGSRWFDVTADKEYVCLDATAGAAIWTETTGVGGSSSISDTSYASSWNGVLDVAPSKNAVYDAYGTLFPTHYERATRPARSAEDTVTVYAGTVVNINEKIFTVAADTDLELNTNGSWDTGTALNDAARAGNDYYVYACDNAGTLALLVSANSTTPTGYTTATSRKIGGFHCLCVAVGTIAGHTLTDFTQGDILPQSVWDLNFRPESEPEGMVWSDAAQVWVDIYLASGTGASTVSVNGGTISDTRNWMDFVDDFGAVKKQLLDDVEFQLIAAGSNEETNITGSADPVTTGGHVDTAARRMISNIGCEDCAGALNQWLSDTSANYDGAVVAGWLDLSGSKGSFYRPVDTDEIKLVAGGHWANATDCGSQCRAAQYGRVHALAAIGGRGKSRKL